MKILLAVTASTWLIGQTADTLGLSSGVENYANLTAIALMGIMFYRIVLKDMPAERLASQQAREQATADSRKHLEKVMTLVIEQHREDRKLDREQWAAEFGKCPAEFGKCRVRNEI